ncbi:MAG: hypothetical protein U9R50_00440, partial [Campylobacterota bacterium]|nr:hypothetical protein [Campylobacterota bacterium]
MGFFTFFNTDKKHLHTDSKPHLALQAYVTLNQLSFYKNIRIFHRHEEETIVSLVFDAYRGLYIFDSVDWEIKQLDKATVSPVTPDKKAHSAIHVDTIHQFIQQKFNEVLHIEGCRLTNIVIFENITKENFDSLDKSFHTLMPKQHLIFADDTPKEIALKLQNILDLLPIPLPTVTLLGALFFHLNILPDNLHKDHVILTQEQYNFISSELPKFSTLSGNYGSGKTSIILLKAIYELLLNPEYKIIIIMPTLAACDLLKKQLLNIIEYAIIDIELLQIHILTPQQVIAQHYQKLYKNKAFNFAKITPKMFSHQYQSSDLVFCDDSYLIDSEFVRYLIKQQTKKRLCLVTLQADDAKKKNYVLPHSFRSPSAFLQGYADEKNAKNSHLHILDENPFMQIMLILGEDLKKIEHSKILIAVIHSQF